MKFRLLSILIGIGLPLMAGVVLSSASGTPSGATSAIKQVGGCDTSIQSIKEAVEQVCSSLKRDQLCYGNVNVSITPTGDADNVSFARVGDTVDLASVESLQLKSLDVASGDWGVALMKVQASLPDSSPDNVTIFLMGDVSVTNQGAALATLPMTTSADANIRLYPSPSGIVFKSLPSGSPVTASGRITNTTGEDWIRVVMEGAPGGVGWIFAPALTTDGDLNSLTTLTSTTSSTYGPMQAFSFSSKPVESPCSTFPDSGLLIQTPQGKGEINFVINQVDIRVGSSVYISSKPGEQLKLKTFEGRALMTTGGVTRLIPAGTMSEVDLDENGEPVGTPDVPASYPDDDLLAFDGVLDWQVFDEQIDPSLPLDETTLIAFNDVFNDDEHPLSLEFYETLLDETNAENTDTLFDTVLSGEYEGDLESYVSAYIVENVDGDLGEDFGSSMDNPPEDDNGSSDSSDTGGDSDGEINDPGSDIGDGTGGGDIGGDMGGDTGGDPGDTGGGDTGGEEEEPAPEP